MPVEHRVQQFRAAATEKAVTVSDRAKEMMGRSEGGVVSRARSLISGDAQFFSAQPKLDQLSKQLDSDSLQDKKHAMKKIIAQICKGVNVSSLFPDVVKNIMCQSIELRKLVYCFILHYAEERPNEALLCISSLQKDLVDTNSFMRSLALRVLSSIRIAAIHPVVMIAIKKCSSDMSSFVRKTACVALAKAYSITKGEESRETIIQLLDMFLGDRAPTVVGAAALSYLEICPERDDLVHRHYRKMCRALVECDEWGQVVILNLLLRYARTQFANPEAPAVRRKEESGSESDTSSEDSDGQGFDIDGDHRLLLQCTRPLLLSLNRSVVIAAAAVYFHCAPVAELDVVVKPMLRLLRSEKESQALVMTVLHTLVSTKMAPFIPHIKEFFIYGNDTALVQDLKLRLIAKLATPANLNIVVRELRTYLRSNDPRKVINAIRGLALIAFTVGEVSVAPLMKLLLPMMNYTNSEIVAEAVIVVRQLVVKSSDPEQTGRIVQRLLQRVLNDEVVAPRARASIVWLVGDNIRSHPNIAKAAPDLFRSLLKNVENEGAQVKRQLLFLGLKLWFFFATQTAPMIERFRNMFRYLIEYASFDEDYDVRDCCRLVTAALESGTAAEATLKDFCTAPKPPPQQRDKLEGREGLLLGSMSHYIGNPTPDYRPLPEWPDVVPDKRVREPAGEHADSSTETASTASSDSFYSDSATATDSETGTGTDTETESESEKSSASGSSGSSSGSEDVKKKKPAAKPEAKPKPVPKTPDKTVSNVIDDLFVVKASANSASKGGFVDPFASLVQPASPAVALPPLPELPGTKIGEHSDLPVSFTDVKESTEQPDMMEMQLHFANMTAQEVTNVHVGKQEDDASIVPFPAIERIGPHEIASTPFRVAPNRLNAFEVWAKGIVVNVELRLTTVQEDDQPAAAPEVALVEPPAEPTETDEANIISPGLLPATGNEEAVAEIVPEDVGGAQMDDFLGGGEEEEKDEAKEEEAEAEAKEEEPEPAAEE